MNKIETFDELFEAVKELYPKTTLNFGDEGDDISKWIDISNERFFDFAEINFQEKTKLLYLFLEPFSENKYLIKNKDPQKIYNIIKAIKEAE